MRPEDEMVTIVDDHNLVIGAVPRREMRAKRMTHRSTYILVFNSKGELFVQKRTLTKDIFPGFYDPVAGGVVLEGERYEEGARRELLEELGIRNVPLDWLFEFYYVDDSLRVWGGAFSCVYDGDVVLQEEEVESGAFMEIGKILRQAKTEAFTPDGMYVLYRYLDEIHAKR